MYFYVCLVYSCSSLFVYVYVLRLPTFLRLRFVCCLLFVCWILFTVYVVCTFTRFALRFCSCSTFVRLHVHFTVVCYIFTFYTFAFVPPFAYIYVCLLHFVLQFTRYVGLFVVYLPVYILLLYLFIYPRFTFTFYVCFTFCSHVLHAFTLQFGYTFSSVCLHVPFILLVVGSLRLFYSLPTPITFILRCCYLFVDLPCSLFVYTFTYVLFTVLLHFTFQFCLHFVHLFYLFTFVVVGCSFVFVVLRLRWFCCCLICYLYYLPTFTIYLFVLIVVVVVVTTFVVVVVDLLLHCLTFVYSYVTVVRLFCLHI